MAQEEEAWSNDPDDYVIIKKIGHGAFSEVFKASYTLQNRLVAIKELDLEDEKTNSEFADISKEIQIMKSSDHPNLLKCFTSFVCGAKLWIITQLCSKGSCLRVLRRAASMNVSTGMNEDWIAYIMYNTLQGIEYLHRNNQIHRDMKAGNILLHEDGTVLVADFGVSGLMVVDGALRKARNTFVGTPCWMAPEVMAQVDGYNEKVDIWSIGITALELATGNAPYANFAPMKVLMKTIDEEPPSLQSYDPVPTQPRNGKAYSSAFRTFLELCLRKDPRRRASATDLLKCKLFKNVSATSLVAELLDHIPRVGESQPVINQRGGQRDRFTSVDMALQGGGGDLNQRLASDYTPGQHDVYEIDEENQHIMDQAKERYNAFLRSHSEEDEERKAQVPGVGVDDYDELIDDQDDTVKNVVSLMQQMPVSNPTQRPRTHSVEDLDDSEVTQQVLRPGASSAMQFQESGSKKPLARQGSGNAVQSSSEFYSLTEGQFLAARQPRGRRWYFPPEDLSKIDEYREGILVDRREREEFNKKRGEGMVDADYNSDDEGEGGGNGKPREENGNNDDDMSNRELMDMLESEENQAQEQGRSEKA